MILLPLLIVATVAVHEAGHAAAALLLRLPFRPTLTRHGPGMVIGNDSIRLTPTQIRLTSLGGPLANLALAVVAFRVGLPLLVLLNAEFALINLVPFRLSDGNRILRGAA